MLRISDASAAFSFDGKSSSKYLNKLNQTLTRMEGLSEDDIHWKADKDWTSKLGKWKR